MDLSIEGKVSLVLASSEGLGRESALVLAMEGSKVVLCSRSEKKLAKAKDYIRQQIRRERGESEKEIWVESYVCDLSRKEQIELLVSKILKRLGRIDILVNNIGGPPSGSFENLEEQAWVEFFEGQILALRRVLKGVLPSMKERGWGRVVNISSVAALEPMDGLILSNSIRAGMHGLIKTLSRELAVYGILLNNVCPGYTWTDRLKVLSEKTAQTRGVSTQEVLETWKHTIPLGRLGRPREIANLIAFLASEKASFITGTSIACDGGASRFVM